MITVGNGGMYYERIINKTFNLDEVGIKIN